MKTMKKGNYWTAYYDPETKRYFAEIMYISREGMEDYKYEITQGIYDRLGTFGKDSEDEEADQAMQKCVKKNNPKKR